jgi:phosphatidylglycerophosphatase A
MATGLGTGYSPLAPGTAGSMLALLIYWLLPLQDIIWIFLSVIFFLIGVWTTGQIESEHGKDPGIAVLDEVVGQWIALVFLPYNVKIYIASFFIFRILDIIKPFPADRAEKLSGGFGIMMDDVIAGIYTNLILQIYLFFFN